MRKIILLIPALLILAGSVYLFYRFRSAPTAGEGILIENTDTIREVPVIRQYGIAVDSFIVYSGKIERNQTLSGLLGEYHVPGKIIDQVAKRSMDIFDLRKIRQGKPYRVFCEPDSSEALRYFVYEHTPVQYLLIELGDSVTVKNEQKVISRKQRSAAGQITTSLWNAMKDQELDPMLAFELSEIYAWSIDFFGLYPGDSFKVIFDEQYAEDEYVGLGKIHGAYFHHSGHDFYAVPFTQDSAESFFDQEGNSLRKAFLKAPLRYSRISSRYSHSRMHPILKIRRPHHGVDYAAPAGTPVYAVGDGEITRASYGKGSGHMVKIKHNSVYTTAYLHLSRYGKGIKPGTYVKQGDLIGYVGSTGLSTGPHLDFRFYKNGYAVDPLKVEAPPVAPVKDSLRARYDSIKKEVMATLNQIKLPRVPVDSTSLLTGMN